MRRLLTALVLLGGILSPLPARAVDCTLPHHQDVTVGTSTETMDHRVRIILPNGYADDLSRSYPVLYLLHGAGDTYEEWTNNTDVEQFSCEKDIKVIIVMPDGGHNANAGWYSDWYDGTRTWETFHITDLVGYVEANYRALGAGHRAIAGLSMGGFGAMSYAARHPGMFAAAASFSGAVDINYAFPLTGPAFAALHDRYGTPGEGVWGNQITNAENWRAHNPTDLAPVYKAAGTKLFLATGTGTPGGPQGDDPSNPGGYGIEQFIFQMNVSFVRALTVAGVDHTDHFYAGGLHSWRYWQDDFQWALPQIAGIIACSATNPCA